MSEEVPIMEKFKSWFNSNIKAPSGDVAKNNRKIASIAAEFSVSEPEPEPENDMNDNKKEPSSQELPPHKLLQCAFITLLKTTYQNDAHDHGSAEYCFRCQHLESFKSLALNYVDEMRYICKDAGLDEPQKNKKFIDTFAVWTYQLMEQNLMLAKSYSESINSVEKLKHVLIESRNSLRHHQAELDKERAKNEGLTYELSLRDQTISKLKKQLKYESEQRREISRELDESKADVTSLTELVIRLRDKGVWDVHGLPMGNETFQKIFHDDYYLHGSKVIGTKEYSHKKKEWREEIEKLKDEKESLKHIIASRDREIHRMKAVVGTKSRSRGGGYGDH